MGVQFLAFIIVVVIAVGSFFASGVLHWHGKSNVKCVQYETTFKEYDTVFTIGSVEVREPVWHQDCKYGVELKPGEKPSDYTNFPTQ